MYFYSLSAIRGYLTSVPFFAIPLTAPNSLSSPIPLAGSTSQPGPSRSVYSNTALVKLSPSGNLVAGAIGRTAVGLFLNPITVIKARYEVSKFLRIPSQYDFPPSIVDGDPYGVARVENTSIGRDGQRRSSSVLTGQSSQYNEYRSMLSAFRSLLSNNGFKGLLQGFTATAARDAPYAGLYLVFYEKGKDLAGRHNPLPRHLS